MKRSIAFTLIEMLVLIVIIAVLSSLAVPAYSRMMAKTRFQSQSAAIVDLLLWAREAAVDARRQCIVTLDIQSGTVSARVEPDDAASDAPAVLQERPGRSGEALERTVRLPDDVFIEQVETFQGGSGLVSGTSRAETLTFSEDGTSTAATMVVRSADGYAAQIEVYPATGRAAVSDDALN